MKHYECVICGYVYVPSEGDADLLIEPGTDIHDIEGFCCPLCGVDVTNFELVEN